MSDSLPDKSQPSLADMLREAICPHCDFATLPKGDSESTGCEWCDERRKLLAHSSAIETPWIDARHFLPDIGKNVVVWSRGAESTFTAERKKDRDGWYCWRSGREIHGVTHWQKPPGGPTDGSAAK